MDSFLAHYQEHISKCLDYFNKNNTDTKNILDKFVYDSKPKYQKIFIPKGTKNLCLVGNHMSFIDYVNQAATQTNINKYILFLYNNKDIICYNFIYKIIFIYIGTSMGSYFMDDTTLKNSIYILPGYKILSNDKNTSFKTNEFNYIKVYNTIYKILSYYPVEAYDMLKNFIMISYDYTVRHRDFDGLKLFFSNIENIGIKILTHKQQSFIIVAKDLYIKENLKVNSGDTIVNVIKRDGTYLFSYDIGIVIFGISDITIYITDEDYIPDNDDIWKNLVKFLNYLIPQYGIYNLPLNNNSPDSE